MAKKYYVHFIDDDPVVTHGPYSIKGAKDFARIGSQYGGRRAVTRGVRGPIIRVYERGHRRWPRGKDEIKRAGLTRGETPKTASPRAPKLLERAWADEVQESARDVLSEPQAAYMSNPWTPRAGESEDAGEATVQLTSQPWGTRHVVRIADLYELYYNNPAAWKAIELIDRSGVTDGTKYRAIMRTGPGDFDFIDLGHIFERPWGWDAHRHAEGWVATSVETPEDAVVALMHARGVGRANPSGGWSRSDSGKLKRILASMIWATAVQQAVEGAAARAALTRAEMSSIYDELAGSPPKGAQVDASRYLRASKKAHGDTPWYAIANSEAVESLEEFAWMVADYVAGNQLEWPMESAGSAGARVKKRVRASSKARGARSRNPRVWR
jgi:hypothetical protein